MVASNILYRFFVLQKMDVTYHGFRAVKTPCGDQLPSHRRLVGPFARFRNNLMFQTAVSAKTICKSSLGQLLAMGFDFIPNTCTAPTFSSAACMRISVVSNRSHEKRTFALTLRVRSSLLLFSQSWIDFGRNGNSHFDGCRPPREVYWQMSVIRFPNPTTPGHIDDPCART